MTTSVITLDMIELFAKFNGISLEDGSQFAGVKGTLLDWEAGRGTLAAELVDAPSLRDTFKPLREAYFKALGKDVPEYSNVNDPAFLSQ